MFKKILAFCLCLCMAMNLSCFAAEENFFYYQHDIAELDAAIQDKATQEKMLRFVKGWINHFEISKEEISDDEITPYFMSWTKTNLRTFYESKNRAETLRQYINDYPHRVVYSVPCYYKGTLMPFESRVACDAEGYKYLEESYFNSTLEEINETMVNVNQKLLTEKLEKEGYFGYTPYLATNVSDLVTILVEKDGELLVYCIGSQLTFERNPGVQERVAGKILEIPEFLKVCEEIEAKTAALYEEAKANGTLENDMSDSSVTTSNDIENTENHINFAGFDSVLFWVIGGAVVLIGGLVTVILVKKKR